MNCNECGQAFVEGDRMVGLTGGNATASPFDDEPVFMPDQHEDYIALYHSGDSDCWDTVAKRIWPAPTKPLPS